MSDNQFQKFSPSAKEVLLKAQEIAESNDAPVSSYHVIMAMLILPQSLAHHILISNKLSIGKIEQFISKQAKNIAETADENTKITRELIDVLEKSMQITASLKHVGLDTEHLLLAALSFPNNAAYKVVKECGVNPKEITQQITNLFDELSQVNNVNESVDEADYPMPPMFSDAAPSRSKKSPENQVAAFVTDLTEEALKDHLDPVIGRDAEIDRVIKILSRRTKNNPVLIGEPGVGKTAIVEGLAARIVKKNVPPNLLDKKVLNLDLSAMVAGTIYRGQFEERIKKFIETISKFNNCIIFVDELHTIIGAGSAEGSLDASQILKPALAKGQIKLIGATTLDEFQKHIEKDAALTRRFQTILVNEPSVQDTLAILHGLKPRYELHHRVKITDEAISAAVNLSNRYITGRFLPDKAIDLLDESAATVRLNQKTTTSLSISLAKIEDLKQKMNTAVAEEHYDQADLCQKQISEIEKQVRRLHRTDATKLPEVTATDVEKTVSLITNTPKSTLVKTDIAQVKNIETVLAKEIIGQPEAIAAVASAIKRSRTGVGLTNRPVGSFMFLGPSGVGKTELAKVIARQIFGKDEALVKIDMSEFMEKHNLSRLIGAPAGYVGYEEGGKLTEIIRRRPYSVVLLDEIEKAHPDVSHILLQILEDGFLTDSKGRKVDFRHTIIIMTSNIGVSELNHQAEIGFNANTLNQSYDQIRDKVLKELKALMKPELLNRLDQIIVFKPLSQDNIRQIVDLQIDQLLTRVNEKGIKLQIDLTARKLLAEKGYDPKNGARPIRRLIQNLIENKIADGILDGKIDANKTVVIRRRGDELELVI